MVNCKYYSSLKKGRWHISVTRYARACRVQHHSILKTANADWQPLTPKQFLFAPVRSTVDISQGDSGVKLLPTQCMFPGNKPGNMQLVISCSPGQALRVPVRQDSQISRQSAHEGGKVVSPTHRPPLPPRKYSWYSFLLEAESTPRAILRPEGLCQWNIPMTQSGIEPTTLQLVAQCLNSLLYSRYRVFPGG